MSYTPPTPHIISTDNTTKDLLGAGATWTGEWEDVTKFATVAVAIFGDNVTDGTLYIESSQDGGTTVNSVPFTIQNASFDLPHIWNIVESHIRIRYTNGSTAQTGFFQLQTKYSNGQELGLLQQANDLITGETDVQIVKAVGTGVKPDGVTYANIPAAGLVFTTKTNLTANQEYSSGILDIQNYQQVQTHVRSSHNGTIGISFFSDSGGTDLVRQLTLPYLSATGFQLFAAPAFSDYVRYNFTNSASESTTDFLYETKLLTGSLNGQVLAVNAPIAEAMVANLGRNVLVSQQPDGTFKNEVHNGVAFTTSDTLTANESYTSEWIDTDGYNSVEVFIKTDQKSTFNGIEVQVTDDLDTGTIRDISYYTFEQKDIDRGFLELFLQPRMVGFRFKYTNGSVAQSNFLAQCDLKVNGENGLRNKGGAVITGDFGTEVNLGNVPNYNGGTQVGIVEVLDAADTDNTIWAFASDDVTPREPRKTWKTSSSQIWIASDSTSDTSKIIRIAYNDANNEEQMVDVTLNGQTPVDTGVSGYDCNNACLLSGADLAGNVYIQHGNGFTAGAPNDNTNVLNFIQAKYGCTMSATYRVPSNKTMEISHFYASASRAAGGNGSANIFIRTQPPGGSWNVIRPYPITNQSPINKSEKIVLDPGTFLEIHTDNISDGDTTVNCAFEYLLINN